MLPKKGTVLDVGSSVGLMLLPYKKMGWKIIGNDPDLTFVEYGKKNIIYQSNAFNLKI